MREELPRWRTLPRRWMWNCSVPARSLGGDVPHQRRRLSAGRRGHARVSGVERTDAFLRAKLAVSCLDAANFFPDHTVLSPSFIGRTLRLVCGALRLAHGFLRFAFG